MKVQFFSAAAGPRRPAHLSSCAGRRQPVNGTLQAIIRVQAINSRTHMHCGSHVRRSSARLSAKCGRPPPSARFSWVLCFSSSLAVSPHPRCSHCRDVRWSRSRSTSILQKYSMHCSGGYCYSRPAQRHASLRSIFFRNRPGFGHCPTTQNGPHTDKLRRDCDEACRPIHTALSMPSLHFQGLGAARILVDYTFQF